MHLLCILLKADTSSCCHPSFIYLSKGKYLFLKLIRKMMTLSIITNFSEIRDEQKHSVSSAYFFPNHLQYFHSEESQVKSITKK